MKSILTTAMLFVATQLLYSTNTIASGGSSQTQKSDVRVIPSPTTIKVFFIKRCGDEIVIKVVKCGYSKQTIDAAFPGNELNEMQQSMTEMDAGLLSANEQNRKTAEHILQTGIRQ